MKILVLGWEYPPFHSGGLGIASKNLTDGLATHNKELKISFALPSFVFNRVEGESGHDSFKLVKHMGDKLIEITEIPTIINSPYMTQESYAQLINEIEMGTDRVCDIYGQNLFQEIERYALEMEKFIQDKDYHIIHAHDWITFAAAAKIKEHKKIPLISHVHATEYDRTGGNPDGEIFKREKAGMENSEKVITVSNYTKGIIMREYGIAENKIEVVHNGIETKYYPHQRKSPHQPGRKSVLFLGRLTIQKGPDWFIKIAKKVLEVRNDVDFLIAGSGEMMPRLVQDTIEHSLKNHVHFLGFIGAEEREKAFANSDAYVLSSVSEPFGLSAVEAAQRGVPVALSNQSGVKEVLYHSLAADFWDVDKMANNILAMLEYPALSNTLSTKATQSLVNLTWKRQAKKVKNIYHQVLSYA